MGFLSTSRGWRTRDEFLDGHCGCKRTHLATSQVELREPTVINSSTAGICARSLKIRTLAILKPETLEKGLEFEILDKIRGRGLQVVDLRRMVASESLLRRHYEEVIERVGPVIGDQIINYMTSGPVMVVVLEGEGAVKSGREIGV